MGVLAARSASAFLRPMPANFYARANRGIKIVERAFIGYEYIRYGEALRMKEFISQVGTHFRYPEEWAPQFLL
jgi:hypothetical protein